MQTPEQLYKAGERKFGDRCPCSRQDMLPLMDRVHKEFLKELDTAWLVRLCFYRQKPMRCSRWSARASVHRAVASRGRGAADRHFEEITGVPASFYKKITDMRQEVQQGQRQGKQDRAEQGQTEPQQQQQQQQNAQAQAPQESTRRSSPLRRSSSCGSSRAWQRHAPEEHALMRRNAEQGLTVVMATMTDSEQVASGKAVSGGAGVLQLVAQPVLPVYRDQHSAPGEADNAETRQRSVEIAGTSVPRI